MIGVTYLKIKRNWRAWVKIAYYSIYNKGLISRLIHRKKEENVIVSLTTIHSRVESVELTVKSIINGNSIPCHIYIYIDEITFLKITSKRSFLMKMVDSGFVQLKLVDDVKSYTKLVYALVEHDEKFIIVCDDDVLYPKYWLSSLLDKYRKLADPKVIVCHRAHEVSLVDNGKLKPYKKWNREVKKIQSASSLLFPTGTGGVLYPPNALPDLATDKNLFLKYAPSGDDIWFWFCALSNGCKFSLTDVPFNKKRFPEVPGSQSTNLWAMNVHKDHNDIQLENCLHFFRHHKGLNLQKILEEKVY